MKKKIFKFISNIMMFIAVVYAAVPCHGKYYEPEMPEELMK